MDGCIIHGLFTNKIGLNDMILDTNIYIILEDTNELYVENKCNMI